MEKVKQILRRFWKLIAAVICFFIVQFVQVGGYYLFELAPFGGDVGAEVVGAAAAAVALVVLGGAAMLKPDWAKIGETFRISWWTLAISAGLMALSISDIVMSGEIAENWLPMLFYTLVFCLGVGFLEEILLRGLILEGLLAVFGGRRVGVVICVLLSSVAFGLMHIDWYSLDSSDSMQVAQAALKVAQTGIFGFCLAAAVVKTGNIVGVSLVHALDDFLLLLPSMVLLGDTALADYVSTDTEQATATIVLYVVMCVLYLPLLISGFRALRQSDVPNLGEFIHDEPVLAAGGAVPLAGMPPAGASYEAGYMAPPAMQPGEPLQQAQPVQTAQPLQPAQPAQTAQPVQPAQPVQTAQPLQPAQPVQPAHFPQASREAMPSSSQPYAAPTPAPAVRPSGAPPRPKGL